jgi:hypothetical protein
MKALAARGETRVDSHPSLHRGETRAEGSTRRKPWAVRLFATHGRGAARVDSPPAPRPLAGSPATTKNAPAPNSQPMNKASIGNRSSISRDAAPLRNQRGRVVFRFPCWARARDRDRGEPCGSAPPTPPCVRVRTRRFGWVSIHTGNSEGSPSEVQVALGRAKLRAGLRLIRHGPWGLPAV